MFFISKILDWSGYIGSGGRVQAESTLWVILISVSPIYAGTLFIGLVLGYFYLITRPVHWEILL
ncbi:MAG: hypothetical protein KPI85_03265 [cyanobacterium endosymbiont of Epithemia adnata isolate EadnSB Bon19]